METTDPRQTLHFFLLAIKLGFPILLCLVVIGLAWMERRRESKKFSVRKPAWQMTEAERITEFRQKYQSSVRTGTR